jgi:membrane protease YdiL (CAAX protease family)
MRDKAIAAAMPQTTPGARAILWAEFAALYAGIPLSLAFVLPASAMWPMMGVALVFAGVVLHRMPGFSWAAQFAWPGRADWRAIAVFTAVCGAISFGLVIALRPEALLMLPIQRPGLWLFILLAYPIASAFPQEVIWRTLFFTRYRPLFPTKAVAVAVNAAAFGLAHLFFWNWVAVAMTAAGSVIFALVYLAAGPRRGLVTATLMHAAAGAMLFTSGLGIFFYHGAIDMVGAP